MRKFIVLSLAVLAFVVANHAYTIKSRIVDGEPAEPAQFPFYVYLDIKMQNPKMRGGCGGSIISDEWILTAAHCLHGARSIGVHMGEYQLNNPEPEHIGIEVDEDGLISHPEYDQRMPVNDIGMYREKKYHLFTQ